MRLIAAQDSEDLLGLVTYWATLGALICVPSSLLVVRSKKTSFLRFAWLPCWAFLASQLCRSMCTAATSVAVRGITGGVTILVLANMLGIMVLRRLDHAELARGGVFTVKDGTLTKLVKSTLFFFNLRAIGTQWKVRLATECTQFLDKRRDSNGNISRSMWLYRTALITAWQYLFMNVLEISSQARAPEETRLLLGDDLEWFYRPATVKQWSTRFVAGYMSRIGPTRISIDLYYRLLAILFVGSGLSTPEAWPPLFGSVVNMSSLRGTWAGITHRMILTPLGTISTFVTRTVLGLRPKSMLDRYVSLFLIFFLSGMFHVLIELFDDDGIRGHELRQVIWYYLLSACGLVIEDIASAVWRRVTGDSKPKLWHKIVGFVWTAVYFTLMAPLFVFPPMRLDAKRKEAVPFDVVGKKGKPVAAGVLVIGGLAVMYGVGGEV